MRFSQCFEGRLFSERVHGKVVAVMPARNAGKTLVMSYNVIPNQKKFLSRSSRWIGEYVDEGGIVRIDDV